MTKILALHGLGSTGEGSGTMKAIRDYFGKDYEVITPTWDINHFQDLVDEVKDLNPDIIIGISMGGYLARYLANKVFKNAQLILLNPVLDATPIMIKHHGTNINFVTGERYIINHTTRQIVDEYYIDRDRLCLSITLVVAVDDTDVNAGIAIGEYNNRARMLILENGGHRLQNVDYLTFVEKSINTLNC